MARGWRARVSSDLQDAVQDPLVVASFYSKTDRYLDPLACTCAYQRLLGGGTAIRPDMQYRKRVHVAMVPVVARLA